MNFEVNKQQSKKDFTFEIFIKKWFSYEKTYKEKSAENYLWSNFVFPDMHEDNEIVYRPIESLDFMIKSLDDILQEEFGKSLADKKIKILDPFIGSGSFITIMISHACTFGNSQNFGFTTPIIVTLGKYKGIICFISYSCLLENVSKNGLSKFFEKEFNKIYIYNIPCKINSNQISKTSVSSYFLVKNGTNKIFEIKYFDVIK